MAKEENTKKHALKWIFEKQGTVTVFLNVKIKAREDAFFS